MHGLTVEALRLAVDLWKSEAEVGNIVPNPASLCEALGLRRRSDLEELRDHQTLGPEVDRAWNFAIDYWYRQLANPKGNTQGAKFALQTLGMLGTEKSNARAAGLHVHIHPGHDRL